MEKEKNLIEANSKRAIPQKVQQGKAEDGNNIRKNREILEIVLVSQARAGKVGKESCGVNDDRGKPDLSEIDDERLIPAKRSSWNSITFDYDDFFGALKPI